MEPIEGRRREILRIVIDDYIATAEPIGSEAVRERHGLNVSSATVRHEMAALEDMGYLNQPHTSAGRVPTDRGYRVYVDSLVTEESLPSAEQTRLRQTLFLQEEPHLAMARVAQALAAGTEYASVVEGPHLHEQVIRHLHLIPLTPRRALIVVVTDAGVFEGKTVEMQAATSPGECDRLSQEISRRVAGWRLGDLTVPAMDQVIGEAALYRQVVTEVGRLVGEQIAAASRIHTEGQANILKQPEFRDARRAEPVLSALERHDVVTEILHDGGSAPVRITIGAEHRREEMRDTSVVAATYHVGGRPAGELAIVGPTRMRYRRAISLVRFLADTLGEALGRL
ncbi:MAG TPA: heat-inducible transcriptional repressor HrcA [bacterium]|nr:heat-inducible transcriptional repressor HrcA [bacterium]